MTFTRTHYSHSLREYGIHKDGRVYCAIQFVASRETAEHKRVLDALVAFLKSGQFPQTASDSSDPPID
jgi:hypothetical protein